MRRVNRFQRWPMTIPLPGAPPNRSSRLATPGSRTTTLSTSTTTSAAHIGSFGCGRSCIPASSFASRWVRKRPSTPPVSTTAPTVGSRSTLRVSWSSSRIKPVVMKLSGGFEKRAVSTRPCCSSCSVSSARSRAAVMRAAAYASRSGCAGRRSFLGRFRQLAALTHAVEGAAQDRDRGRHCERRKTSVPVSPCSAPPCLRSPARRRGRSGRGGASVSAWCSPARTRRCSACPPAARGAAGGFG